jgi:sigma-B regulation protein RsbU (phosphoserine phosphatase)
MSLRHRITLLIVVLLTVSITGNSALLVWLGERAVLQRALGDGVAIARLLANGVALSERLPGIVDAQLDRQMVAQAALAEELVDLAHQQGLPDTELDARLAQIVARTAIKRIMALDRNGMVVTQVTRQFEPPLPGDHEIALTRAFAQTGPGKNWAQALSPLKLPGHASRMRFAGVRAQTGDGLVVIGQGLAASRALRHQIGPERNISAMVGAAGIESIWIFGEREELLARSSLDRDPASTTATTPELAGVRKVIQTGDPLSLNDGDVIRVIAPVLDDDGLPMGATLVRFSTAAVHEAVRRTILVAIALTLALLVVGVIVADRLGRRIARPIVAIADAARAVHRHAYDDRMMAPISARGDEIGSLARDFADMAKKVLAREEELDRLVASRTQQLNERNTELTQAIAVIQEDLEAARLLQHAILPQHFPLAPSFAGVAIMTAARHIGGDFYDFFMVDEDHLAILIADVSGKGVPAALFMAISRTILRAQAMATPQPSECVRRANDQICTQNPMYLFITVFYGLLNVRTGVFRFVNAGHPSPVLLQPAEREVSPLPWTEGVALGVVEDVVYREDQVTLSPGDTMVLYTDGVSEAMDNSGSEFTDARILETLGGELDDAVDGILRHLMQDVRKFVAGAPQSDDLTCVVLRYLGDPAATGPDESRERVPAPSAA